MERRVLLASLLSFAFLSLYLQAVSPKRPLVSQTTPSQGTPQLETPTPKLAARMEEEPVIKLESERLSVEVGVHSASIRRARLTQFPATDQHGPVTFGEEFPILAMQFAKERPKVKMVAQDVRRVEFLIGDENYHISYELDDRNGLLKIVLDRKMLEQNRARFIATWHQSDHLNSNMLELIERQIVKEKSRYRKHRGPWKSEKNVPRGTFEPATIVSLSERYFTCALKSAKGFLIEPIFSSEHSLAAAIAPIDADASIDQQQLELYIGPRDYFYLKKWGFEEAFPIGLFGRIGLVLLFFLSGVAGIVKNYGVAIILFSVLISCATAPFTLISLKSAKKMQQVAPLMEKIRAAHKNDPKKQQEEMMRLYREHKVSPLGGCFGMIFQIPILIALVQAMSHYIELRGKSFLWIADLSLPDRTAKLPMLLPFFGNELNVLPLIMAAAMVLQMRLSQRAMPKDQNNPMASMMSGPMMPLIFGLTLYHFPSGLILYWLTNTLTSMVWYRVAK